MSLSKRFISGYLYDTLEQEKTVYYLKTDFINKLYFYYINNGYVNILTSQICNIFINLLTLFVIIFLLQCVDYNLLVNFNDKTRLSDISNFNNIFKINYLFVMIIIFFIIVIICKILNCINNFFVFKKIKNFYNEINIKDKELSGVKWENILLKIKHKFNDDDVDVYYISNKIMNKDNYMIALIDKKIIEISHLTKLMEWNLMYCIIHYLYDEDIEIDGDLSNKKHQDSISKRLKIVSIVNFIFMPFLLVFIIFYNIFEYSEKFYNKPSLVAGKSWTLLAKWKFRNYNETYHNFQIRLRNSEKAAKEYCDEFHSKLLETISKLLIYVLSTFFTILIFFSLINENVLLNLYIIGDKTAIWFIGICVTSIALLGNFINDKIIFNPKEKMLNLKDIIPDLDYLKENNVSESKKEFDKLYQYKLQILIKDILYILIVPFYLWDLSYNTKQIMKFIDSNTIKHRKIGRTCKLSLFDNIIGLDNNVGDEKTIRSYSAFKDSHNLWYDEVNKLNSSSLRII